MMKNENNKGNVTAEEMVLQVTRIKNIYEEMLNTLKEDIAYRAKLVKTLLHMQKEDGSWNVIDCEKAPSDARVYYKYIPTYYATAALMYADLYDDFVRASEEKEALLRGLEIAKGRGLCGHGFEATASMLESLNVYKKAGLYEWIKEPGNLDNEFGKMIQDLIENLKNAVATGRTVSDWQEDFKEQFENEIAEYEESMISYVWYAAYGSNINKSRFMKYIEACTDTTEPLEDRTFMIPHNIYFAYNSSRWNRKGVAFLDDSKEGMAWGRIYKISRKQFLEIQEKEGRIYGKKLSLGNVEGIPVYTFTAPEIRTDLNSPCVDYVNVILDGLKEVYPEKSALVLETYLFSRGILNGDDYKVLTFIRNSEHAVCLKEIVDGGMPVTRMKKTVSKLYDYGFVKQDGRSVATGEDKLSLEAKVYTCKGKRGMIDILVSFSVGG